MSSSIQLGYVGCGNIGDYDFIVSYHKDYLGANKAISLSCLFNKPIRVSCLWGNNHYSKSTSIAKYEAFAKHNIEFCEPYVSQVELLNEFITDTNLLTFSIEQIHTLVDLVRRKNKEVMISEFKPWNTNRWKFLNSIVKEVKPDSVGIQLHLKCNYNAEVVLTRLPAIIMDLQDLGVRVHFSEVSVWRNKTISITPSNFIWDWIFKLAVDHKIKSLTPWFFGNPDNAMPTFNNWINCEYNKKQWI